MKGYFLTATGTGVGKTLVACALAHQLRTQGRRVRAIKPVISGFEAGGIAESDTGLLLAAQGLPLSQDFVEGISPWRFAAPLSPDMAASAEGRAIDFERLTAFCRKEADGDILLIEGIGGIMTPLTEGRTVLDWALALDLPVILVAGSYLGTLSHTLTSARVITHAGLRLHSVVVSESESAPVTISRTLAALRRFLPETVLLAAISRLDSSVELWKYAPDLTQALAL